MSPATFNLPFNNHPNSDQHVHQHGSTLANILVYKHCFYYLNIENDKQKNPFFNQPIVMWMAVNNNMSRH